jgi:hypothetical protein
MGTGYTGGQFGQWWNEGQWTWEKLFAWLPRQLASTGEWVWLTEVYLGQREVHGPGEPVILRKYLTPEEFTWEQLTEV